MKRVMYFIFLSILFICNTYAQIGCDNFTEGAYHIFGQYNDYEHGNWELIFEDNFNVSAIDKERWFTCIDGWNREHGNTELQYYLDDNVVIYDGILRLIAERKPGYYNVWRFDNNSNGYTIDRFFEYTSGWIQTKMYFQYGLFEVRCKIPDGQGFWPAFWLFGNGDEIDIFEFASNAQNEHLTTIHKWYDDGSHDFCPDNWESSTSFANDFHTFSLEWNEFVLIYRVDGIIKRTVYNYYNILGQSIGNYQSATNGIHTRFALFPSNPQSMILNLAIPGENSNFGEPPTSQTTFPSSLDIDYVRVYKRMNPDRNITICDYNSSDDNNYTGRTISVAGNCNVVLSNDENMGLVACNEIVLGNGFEALEGCSFSARISSSAKDNNTKPLSRYNNISEIDCFSTLDSINVLKNNSSMTDIKKDIFEIYPNPNKGNFQIKSYKRYKQIIILDIYGNLIYNINNPIGYIHSIDIPYKQGLYTIKCVFDDKIEIKRLIIS